MDHVKEVKITIPPRTILTIVATLFGVWLVYQVSDIVTLFLIVLSTVVVFSPIIRAWERYIPRTLAIILLYLLLFSGLITISALVVPVVINQLNDLLQYIESALFIDGSTSDFALRRAQENIDLILAGKGFQVFSQFVNQFKGSLGVVYSTTLGFLGGVVAVVTVFITSFYLLLEEKNFHGFIAKLVPQNDRHKIATIVDSISNKMGNWLRGQLFLMFAVGIITTLVLAILGVPYALLLGLWAGLMELIPYVGPVVGAIPGVFIAISSFGLAKGLAVLLAYLIIQQIENQFLVPKIMGKALGLSPVAIIFALLVGGKLLGLIGVIIAIPIMVIASVIYEQWHYKS